MNSDRNLIYKPRANSGNNGKKHAITTAAFTSMGICVAELENILHSP